MTPTMLLPWQHSWLHSHSVKNQIFPFATLIKVLLRILLGTHMVSHIVLTILNRLLRVDDPCLR